MAYQDRDYYRPRGFGGFSFFPPVIKILLIINISVFFVQMIFNNIQFGGEPGWFFLNQLFALNPINLDGVSQWPYNFQIWQVITYQFMHGDFFHIFFNMFILWMFGVEIENMWGSNKFLTFYLAGGVTAALAQLFVAPMFGSVGYTVGASGSIFAVMIAFGMTFPDRYVFLLFPPIPVKAKYLIAFLVLIELFSIGDASLIARLAHLGGALFGFVFVMYDKRNNINVDRWFRKIKELFSSSGGSNQTQFRKTRRDRSEDVQDAEFYEINSKSKKDKSDEIDQDEIDAILDKISKDGYQNLTDREKRILFEASKKE